VGSATGVRNAFNAAITIRLRTARSASAGSEGSPQGWVILRAGTIRLTPSCFARGNIVVTTATGKPALSSSLAIADPLRVQVPQVATRSTPSTPPAFMSWLISRAIFSMT